MDDEKEQMQSTIQTELFIELPALLFPTLRPGIWLIAITVYDIQQFPIINYLLNCLLYYSRLFVQSVSIQKCDEV